MQSWRGEPERRGLKSAFCLLCLLLWRGNRLDLDGFRRDPSHDVVRRHILRGHADRADHSMFSDTHSAHYCGMVGYACAWADLSFVVGNDHAVVQVVSVSVDVRIIRN